MRTVDFLISRNTSISRTTARAKLGLALAAALSLGGCLGYDGTVVRGFVVDEKVMAQIKTGATKEQILSSVGTPSTTSTIGGDAWYYISQTVERELAFSKPAVTDQRVVAIYFKNNRVERYADYGLKDGVLFDFVTRATPTGGAEPSFVRNMFRSFGRVL
jgi:outer membrane protein assembly factor BamE (lipoprotein component of BamABCDE complex)